MKILMLTPYLPYPLLSGGQVRSFNLIKKMAEKHEITLFALIRDEKEKDYISELEKYCAQVRVFKRAAKPFTFQNILRAGLTSFTKNNYPFVVIRNYSSEAYEAVKEELHHQHYDLIHAETFYMMPHIPQTHVPKLLVEQTIEYLGYESFAQNIKPPFNLLFKPFFNWDIKKIKKWERHYWRSCNLLVTMSEEDKKLIAKDLSPSKQRIEVVANGVDIKFFQQSKKAVKIAEPTVLFVGTFKWLPNIEAAQFLVEEVWPLIKAQIKNAKLWIVGNAPTPEVLAFANKEKNIVVTGGIPDIRDAYNNSHIICAPVFSGKGTRYKILEAMATATPIVATSTAVEGLNITEKQALIADTPEDMAQAAIKLLNDPQLQKTLARNGQSYVAKHYDWDIIARKLDQLYQAIDRAAQKK